VIAYKFLDPGGIAPFTGFGWPVGEWVDSSGADPCRCGIHACRVRDLPIWLGAELWEIELDGDVIEEERKLVAPRGRLNRPVEEWNDDLAAAFGRFCAKRTRERVGFLPLLSGYVGDVAHFVSDRRFPIAGFAAARAAELRDGPAGYERERLVQAGWLADRLGLERPESL
jgi:hypothetical protein